MDDMAMAAAGRTIPGALDRIRRYCGLSWSGGEPETWAWHYYDAIPTNHDEVVTPTDVVCAAALHPTLSRGDLSYFREASAAVSAWLEGVPSGQRLGELSEEVVEHVAALPNALVGPSLSLLSKVLHRKRPDALPVLDRHLVDWYRPLTGKRAAAEAWGPLVSAMRDEQRGDEHRLMLISAVSGIERALRAEASTERPTRLSWLRATDIAIWMGSR